MTDRRSIGWLLAASVLAIACSEDERVRGDDAWCTNKCDDNVSTFALPDYLDIGGDPSSIAVRDLDGDGFLDIAALVKDPDRTNATALALVVAFGDAAGVWQQRYRRTWTAPVVPETRDSSTSVVAIADIDRDGDLDIATASGIAHNASGRNFTWVTFGDEAWNALHPVGIVAGTTTTTVVRGTAAGIVERCNASGLCTSLPNQPAPCDMTLLCSVEDILIADFTGDGNVDVLAGSVPQVEGTESVVVWEPANSWQQRAVVDGMSAVDLEVGDIDKDGFADVVAQVRETISDFPSYTDVWFGTGGGATLLTHGQHLYNNDNHNDNAALADANGDGCLDLMMIGVDTGKTAQRRGVPSATGCARHLGPHDPAANVDVGWTLVPGYDAIGIQQLDVNGDGADDWVVRARLDDGRKVLRFASPI